jgi:hypothetical protein
MAYARRGTTRACELPASEPIGCPAGIDKAVKGCPKDPRFDPKNA